MLRKGKDLIRDLQTEAQKKSQIQIARELGISAQYLNDILHNRRSISAEVALSMGYKKCVRYIKL